MFVCFIYRLMMTTIGRGPKHVAPYFVTKFMLGGECMYRLLLTNMLGFHVDSVSSVASCTLVITYLCVQ